MDEIAKNLNETILKNNPNVYEVLSKLGKNLFCPKGILSQSAEASKMKAQFNATIGIATEKKGPMHFKHIQSTLKGYSPNDIYPYAPPSGKQELRKIWKQKLLNENPSLQLKRFGDPIVTNALTHGLSLAADLFVDENDFIILPDKYWDNYQTIFHDLRGGILRTFPLFNDDNLFNVSAFRDCLMEQKESGKAIVVLNFPNNPTGYTPSDAEVEGIISALLEAANSDIKTVLIIDDAYFGLFYEDSIQESLFGRVANLHPKILPVKVDGATKEIYVWGLRVGFITFASESKEVLASLEQKVNGLIRGTISSSSHLSQTIILESLQSNEYKNEKVEKYELLKRRAKKVKEIVSQEKYNEYLSFYPFNSGYFMCIKLLQINAEQLRLHLLHEYGVGTIAINSTDLRIAFSCVEEDELELLFELIFKGITDLHAKVVY